VRFVLVDRLLELQPGHRAVALKTFRADDDVFQDHFPGFPIVPGVLITESMGQTAGWLLVATLGFARVPLLTMIENAKFRRIVLPGDELELIARIDTVRTDDFAVRVEARTHGQRAADALLRFHAFGAAFSEEATRAFEEWARRTFKAIGGEDLRAPAGSTARS
jgi:3-hydroxyacyl-[acyl-carrier-protein] dehydratase